jgi:predicted N-formylglutamate amidohydrolase
LRSHRGWDRGALGIAEALARTLDAPLVAATTTRLLVDLNRTKGHPAHFGPRVRLLPKVARARIDRDIYDTYFQELEAILLRQGKRHGAVLHVSVHTFAPVVRGQRRAADVGVLYDPTRHREKELASKLAQRLHVQRPGLRVRRNYPYRGTTNGMVTLLRRRYPRQWYLGLEVEANQILVRSSRSLGEVCADLARAFHGLAGRATPPRVK